MNLPVILAVVSAGLLAVLLGSTYFDPATARGGMPEAARAALFYPSPIVEREHLPDHLYRHG